MDKGAVCEDVIVIEKTAIPYEEPMDPLNPFDTLLTEPSLTETSLTEPSLTDYEREPVNTSFEPMQLIQDVIVKERRPSKEIISIKIVGREKRILVRDNATGIISVIRKPC